MLLDRSSSKFPQGPFTATKNPRDRVEFIQRIDDSFWVRWTNDVFQSLVPRTKWSLDRRNVQVNDMVMTVDAEAIRGKWTIGRIVEVHPGSDGKVRNVAVRTPTGEYRRPITKVSVIYPTERYEDDDAVIGGEDVYIRNLINMQTWQNGGKVNFFIFSRSGFPLNL